MGPVLIAIIGAILAIVGASIQYREKEQSKLKAEEAKKEAADFNAKLLETQSQLISAQQQAKLESDNANSEILRLNNELLQKTEGLLSESEQAKKAQQETINFILGSGMPELSFYGRNSSTYSPVLFNPTKYPVYDLSITIDDYNKVLENCKIVQLPDKILIDDDCLSKYSTLQGKYFIAPGARQKITLSLKTNEAFQHYRIQCISRTRIIAYYCIVKISENNISSSIRVYELKNSKSHFIKELNYGLSFDENHWNKHFLLHKEIWTGPIPND